MLKYFGNINTNTRYKIKEMIKTEEFYDELIQNGIGFFTGIPDSLLKDICAYITENTATDKNIIAANEGAAVAIATGYNLATNKIPLVFMQNSGIGNAINPLLSLADKEVYAIPMILLIGWRGEPNIKDEPQHIKQGRVTNNLLEAMEIPCFIIDANSSFKSILKEAVKTCKNSSNPVAILVRKNTFESFNAPSKRDYYLKSREEALKVVLDYIPENSIIVSTTGMLSRELYELRKKNSKHKSLDFLTVGSMGHASQIAMGIAMQKPNSTIFCLDGDGAAIMHLGAMAIIGQSKLKNFNHIIFNNGAHDSVGGQPTVAFEINFLSIATACGYQYVSCNSNNCIGLESQLREILQFEGPTFLEIRIKKGARKDLGRPIEKPIENKLNFIKNI